MRRINELDEQFKTLSDDDLRAKTTQWQTELAQMADPDERWQQLDKILPEAFAVVKNGARRLTEMQHSFTVCDQPMTWNMVHFDVQLVGGMVLHRGRIAEMATGEGKTLVATLPLYLNALAGRGAHLVTVNDYLARRDAEWMGQLFTFLGLTVGCIQHDQPPDVRREQYACDITYGTNSEFGFDYLRDNGMATTREQQVQRGYHFAIVDEVDSILIDEARTPLIISGPSTVSTHQYDKWKPLVEQLVRKQNMLCNRLASEAKEAFRRQGDSRRAGGLLDVQSEARAAAQQAVAPDDGGSGEAQGDGQSRARRFTRTRARKSCSRSRKSCSSRSTRSRTSRISRSRRAQFLNPDDPDAFVLPDLISEFTEIDLNSGPLRRGEGAA